MKIDDCFSGGGAKLINLLNFCVFSVNTDALFLYLVREYRFQPTSAAALALFELFCEQSSPAVISTSSLLQTSDRRLADAVAGIRQFVDEHPPQPVQPEADDRDGLDRDGPEPILAETRQTDAGPGPIDGNAAASDQTDSDDSWISNPGWSDSPTIESVDYSACPRPPVSLFDFAERQLRASGSKNLLMIERVYRPEARPLENLPGKKMSSGQRRFVDGVWCPTVRPRLVAAGFWRVASIG